MKTPLAVALLFLVLAPPALAQTAADTAFRATTLNLNATGESKAAPDMATITLGVSVQAPSAAQAMALNAQRMSDVVAALRRQGLADADIQTSNLSLNPQYVYAQNQPAKLTGYQANNDVSIRVKDLRRLGAVIDAVTAAGANQINGIGFGLSSPAAAENDARREAVKALTARAELYAQATGYHVARLVNLSEGGGYQPPAPRAFMAGFAKSAAPSTPIEAGELTVRIDLQAVYELAR